MADIVQNIALNTTGGEASAAEIQKTTDALKNVTSTSAGMRGEFQERFQHIGLMLFAGDALRASGLGAETRMVVNSLNTALSAGAEAAGISSGGFLLIVTALGALAGAIVKVVEHHKDLLEQLKKTHDANEQMIAANDKTIESLQKYIAEGGHATDAQLAWLAATEKLRDALIKQQEVTDQDTIATLKNVIAKDQAANKTLSLWQATELLAASTLKSIGLASASDAIVKRVSDSINAQNLALQKNKTALEASIAELEQLRQGHTKTISDMASNEAELTAAIQAEVNRRQQAYEKMQAGIDEVNEKGQKMQEEQWAKTGQIVKGIVGQIGADFGNAFAKMIVEGKDFGQQMQEAFKNMAEQIISDLIRIEIEWMVLSSMGFPTGGLGGFAGFGGAFATGGSVMVDKPTLFLAGEAGPETATFTPAGSPSTSGGGGGSVGTVQINLSVGSIQGNDPAGTLDMLSQEIRRQTAAARQFSATVVGVANQNPNQAY